MSKLKELREKRQETFKSLQQMRDKITAENRDFNPEETTQWDAVNKEFDAIDAKIKTEERMAEIEGRMAPPGKPDDGGGEHRTGESRQRRKQRTAELPNEETRSLSLQSWFRCQKGVRLTDKHVNACKQLRVDPRKPHFDIRLDRNYENARALHSTAFNGYAMRAGLLAGTGNVGGYTIPQGFVPRFEIALLAYSQMRQVAEVMRTDSGNTMYWPTANDTSNSGEIISEQGSIGSTVDATVSRMALGAFKYSSKLMKITSELLQDSAFDMAAQIGAWAGERIARKQNSDFTVGGGTTLPYGVVTQASAGVTTASTTAIAADELIDLQHSLDPAYRLEAGFMFHDTIAKSLRKLKDGEGQYLWQPDFGAGMRNTLLGSPTFINQHMSSSIAAAEKTVLYGMYSKYKIRDVTGIRLKRLEELYAATDEVGFIMFMRGDGNLLDAGTHPVKLLAQHA